MNRTFEIESVGVTAVVSRIGAELRSLKGKDGSELLWQAGPEWPRHAPVLFPVVGRLTGDRLHHGGRSYPMFQHGFARDMVFDIVEENERSVALRLVDNEETRAQYPFAFVLDIHVEAIGTTLSVRTTITNPGGTPLACGIGAHPGFAWPLVEGVPKDRHRIVFEKRESGQALGVEGGLLSDPCPLPFDGKSLPLSDALFAEDALVMPGIASRSVTYQAVSETGDVARALTVSWDGYKDLGIWSKPGGAPFVCIEPWYSMASPEGFDADIFDKPGILVLEAGEHRSFAWSITI
ncbi:aldose 1-epimerase family protein [Fulvimarina sp. 2208YS6-2-32]|uniref:Aldose 1-epimerase family protein n=1 Tax=Fulvimarina uroteuthidis TaxID=3098149 RepID=A0ABU5I104_9HYPH|nr:aldose 1-epimerase family protein [Fulvimarina sp. 2208YS6-2-32]MDY8107856.1 aldose 1-epimerase family protein [Fulvimarina sp. 2208YS6-2-32]